MYVLYVLNERTYLVRVVFRAPPLPRRESAVILLVFVFCSAVCINRRTQIKRDERDRAYRVDGHFLLLLFLLCCCCRFKRRREREGLLSVCVCVFFVKQLCMCMLKVSRFFESKNYQYVVEIYFELIQ